MAVKPSSLARRAEPLGTAWTTAFVDPEDSGPGKALAAAPLDRRIATARPHWTLHSAPTHYINVPFKGRDRGLILRCLLDALSIIGTVLVSWTRSIVWYFGDFGHWDATPYRRYT